MNRAQRTETPAPTRAEHERFCRVEGWKQVRESTAENSRFAVYELALADGQILRTRIGFPAGRAGYGPAMWEHILDDQLHVTESAFRTCVRDGVPPGRGVPKPDAEALPIGLVHLLITRVGLAEQDVMEMTKGEAIERLNRFWTEEM